MTIKNWIIVHALWMAIWGYLCMNHLPLNGILAIGVLSFLALLYLGRPIFSQNTPYGGYANWITLFRLLLLMVTTFQLEQFSIIQLFVLLSLCLILDGVDGKVARQYQQESDWGALFDKEVDSFFVLVVSLILYQYYGIPIWIVGIGLLHYLYEIVLYFLNWQPILTKKNPIGRYVAFLLFASLLVPLLINGTWVVVLLGIISGLTLVSFGVSFFMKYRGWRIKTQRNWGE